MSPGTNLPEPTTAKKKSKKNFVILIISIFIVFTAGTVLTCLLLLNKPEPTQDNPTKPVAKTELRETEGVTIVPTMLDEITTDSAWCGTFQLVWNDMKNEVVGGDVVFNDGNIPEVDNLNKETFKESDLSDDYYYKTYGLKTLALKAGFEQGIKDKFDETSDVLDDLDWSEDGVNNPNNPDVNRYLFYAMLKRKFEYPFVLNKLDNQKFADTDNVAYFGTKGVGSDAYKQFEVLYYNSKDDFAIQLNTKDRDELIFVKNPQGKNFDDIYKDVEVKTDAYEGSSRFQDSDKYIDDFKAPNLALNLKKKYKELTGHTFPIVKNPGRIGEIIAAIQTVQFQLDEKGGEIKSEAVIDMVDATSVEEPAPSTPEHRYFYLDDTFAIFLRENGKDQPYFAARINDVTKYQQ